MRLLLVSIVFLVLAGPVAADSILISELLADPSGKDDGGVFLEIFGPGLASLDGYVLEVRNGSGGSVTHEVSLSGLVLPADGFFVIADGRDGATTVVGADLIIEDFDLQNGPESVLLRVGDDVVDALAYGTFGAAHAWFGEGDPAPTGSSGTSLARIYANLDSNDNRVDFAVLDPPTPGTGSIFVPDEKPVPEPRPIPEPSPALCVILGGLAVAVAAIRRPRCGRVATRTRSRSR